MTPVDLLIAIAAGVAFVIAPFLIIAGLSYLGLVVDLLWHLCGDIYHSHAPHAHSV